MNSFLDMNCVQCPLRYLSTVKCCIYAKMMGLDWIISKILSRSNGMTILFYDSVLLPLVSKAIVGPITLLIVPSLPEGTLKGNTSHKKAIYILKGMHVREDWQCCPLWCVETRY